MSEPEETIVQMNGVPMFIYGWSLSRAHSFHVRRLEVGWRYAWPRHFDQYAYRFDRQGD